MPRVRASDGVEIAYERRGTAPISAVFVHATGFCKETWWPVLDALGETQAVLIDQRGHGESQVDQPPFDWWDLGRDVGAVLDDTGAEVPVIGVGHSSGAAALVMSEVLRPGSFNRLVLVEPIIFPPPFERTEDHVLTRAARRRRPAFDSRDEAASAYRDRPPFAKWDERAFDAYLDHGFHEVDGRWTLRCRPEIEAEFYCGATAHGVWDRMDEVGCRVDVVVGAQSDSHPVSFGRNLAERFEDGWLVIIDDATHFVPAEQPVRIAEVISST